MSLQEGQTTESQSLMVLWLFVLATKVVKTIMHLPGFKVNPEIIENSENNLKSDGILAMRFKAPMSSAQALQEASAEFSKCILKNSIADL